MKGSPSNWVLHVGRDTQGDTSARLAELGLDPATRCESASDVFRALPRILCCGALPDAVILDADELLPEEFEFLRLLARHYPTLSVHTYGSESARVQAAQCLTQSSASTPKRPAANEVRESLTQSDMPSRSASGVVGIESCQPLAAAEPSRDEPDHRESLQQLTDAPRAAAATKPRDPGIDLVTQSAPVQNDPQDKAPPPTSDTPKLDSSKLGPGPAPDQLNEPSLETRLTGGDEEFDDASAGPALTAPQTADFVQQSSDTARVPWKKYDQPKRIPPGQRKPEANQPPESSAGLRSSESAPSEPEPAVSTTPQADESPARPSPTSTADRFDRFAPLLTPEEIDALMFDEDELAESHSSQRRHLLGDEANSDLP